MNNNIRMKHYYYYYKIIIINYSRILLELRFVFVSLNKCDMKHGYSRLDEWYSIDHIFSEATLLTRYSGLSSGENSFLMLIDDCCI